jgi:hypothetical protein
MSKKKLIITITSLCLVVVAAVAAVIGVVAASTQTVNANVSVVYRATNVKAVISVDSRWQNDATWGTTLQGGSANFYATEASTTKTAIVTPNAIRLGNSASSGWTYERYVIYRFEFLNNYAAETTTGNTTTPAEGRALNVSLTYDSSKVSQTNSVIAVATKLSATELPTDKTGDPHIGYVPSASTDENGDGDEVFASWTAVKTFQAAQTGYDPETDASEYADLTSTAVTVSNIPQGQYAYFYILIMISNPDADMSFATTAPTAFTFGLSTTRVTGDSNPTNDNN